MRLFKELKDDQTKSYKDRCEAFRISEQLLMERKEKDAISIAKLVEKSKDFENLKENIREELLNDKETDYFHFSLLFGLYFDVFNSYPYLYISPEVRKIILKKEIKNSITRDFLSKNQSLLEKYFSEQYGIDSDFYHSIVDSLFQVNHQNSILYHPDIIMDIGKILMGYSLSDSFFGCKEAINSFEDKNNNTVEKIQ